MNYSSPVGNSVRRLARRTAMLSSFPIMLASCLERPVVEATPTITARVTQAASQTSIGGIDLLFMIDNSSSMADKQDILASAVPALLERLTHPNCVDPTSGRKFDPPQDGRCARGELEFNPVSSMHIAIVSSSLGDHGVGDRCVDIPTDPTSHNNDKGELVVRGTSGSVNDGFLDWKKNPDEVSTSFQKMVRSVGQHGCGYESQLEAPYRFLIDPAPPASVHMGKNADGMDVIVAEGIDETILSQRQRFLRPDSLVAVIMVTDENDCSLKEEGQAWMALSELDDHVHSRMRPGTDPCNTNPNDPCCFNCAQAAPPGCPAADTYSNCVKDGEKVFFTMAEDPLNLRCWDQKRRYGIDFLYPVDRYIKGYTQATIQDRDRKDVPNPLFDDLSCPEGTAGCTRHAGRDKGLIFVAGIVGVPWQDIANDPTDPAKGFKSTVKGKNFPWDLVLGNPTASPPVAPKDPLMIESVDPRAATSTENPMGDAALPDKKLTDGPEANPINGHEWDPGRASPARADLQYACVFKLPTPRDCANASGDCDCLDYSKSNGGPGPNDYKSPLCQDKNGTFGTMQYRAKGYPGIRELQVLQGIGEQAIVASVCPAMVEGDTRDEAYGYNPAVESIIDRLKVVLRGRCLPRPLKASADGSYPCAIYEGFEPDEGSDCRCVGDEKHPGRVPSETPLSQLPENISKHKCICLIDQLKGDEKTACQSTEDLSQVNAAGWCYVDPSNGEMPNHHSACSIVKSCPATNRRIIRFAGPNQMGEPRSGADAVIICQEASFIGNEEDPCATP